MQEPSKAHCWASCGRKPQLLLAAALPLQQMNTAAPPLQLLMVLSCRLWLLTGAAGGVVLKTHLPQQLLSQSCRQRAKQLLLLLGATLLQLLVQASLLRGRLRQLLVLQEQWMLQWQARLLWAQAMQLQWVWVLWSSQ